MITLLSGNIVYLTAVMIFCCGLFIIIVSDHYVKKIIGLGLFQSAVLIFYIALGKLDSGKVPIADDCVSGSDCAQNTLDTIMVFSSPLPHVLMLTAIVVGFATTAAALALSLRIKQEYNSLSATTIRDLMHSTDRTQLDLE